MSPPAAVPVFALHTDTVRQADLSGMALRMPERMKKAARYRFERDRLLCIGAGLLMLSALGIPDESALAFGPFGKPYAPGYPAFSLSHSGDWCVLALDSDPVGIDLEKPSETALAAAPRVFTPDERTWMGEAPLERFFQLWTWKESVMKATGRGLDLAPESFSVLCFTRNEPLVLDQRCWYAASGTLDSYPFSVCSSRPASVSLRILDAVPASIHSQFMV